MSEELALRGDYSETGLTLANDLTYEEWRDTGHTLGRIERASRWWIGDWINYGEAKYGETYSQALDVLGLPLGSLSSYASIAARVPTRVGSLDWDHHRAVADLEPVEQVEWLKRAVENDWTTRQLRQELRPDPPPPPSGTFSILYADPPWQYDFSLTDSRQIENQYPTLTAEEIGDLDLPKIAPDAVLFLWATAPKLLEALAVIDAWGFTYKTNAIWDKVKLGMGYWFRGRHELLLVATRGQFSPPAEEQRVPSVLNGDRSDHSKKPSEVAEWIEEWWPELPKVELFAREQRQGWTAWGSEL